MRGNIQFIRPAGAAIAAVLAITSTYSFAQDAVVVPPVTANPDAPMAETTPAAPIFTPSQPVVQSTPSVDERLNAAIAASEAEKSAARPQGPQGRTVPARAQPSSSAATPSRAASAPDASTVEQRPASPVDAPPAPAPVAVSPEPAPAVQAEPGPVEQTATSSDSALYFGLGGGALLLLGVAGAVALRRRGSRNEEDYVAAPLFDEASTYTPPTVEPVQPRIAQPLPSTPAPMAAGMAAGAHDDRLEAMAAAPPSPENPFLTYKKRRARAKFLLAQEHGQDALARAPIEERPIAKTPAPSIVQTQTVYRFGSDKGRSSGFKPQTR